MVRATYPASNGYLNLLSLSACLFKGSKPIRKFRNTNDDVVCGGRSEFDIVWKKEVNRFFRGGIPFFKERDQLGNVVFSIQEEELVSIPPILDNVGPIILVQSFYESRWAPGHDDFRKSHQKV